MDGIEARYYRAIKEYLTAYREELKSQLRHALPAIRLGVHQVTPDVLRQDDPLDDLERMFDSVRLVMGRRYTDAELEAMAARTGESVADITRRSVERQWKRVTGLDLLTSNAGIGDFLKLMSKQNAQLITSIPERHLSTLQTGIFEAVRRGDRVEEIAAWIDDRFEVMDGNAATIARTEVNKLHGQLSSYQQQEVGVAKYTWTTARDERVRPSHEALDGQVFTWDPNGDPAIGQDGGAIMPGQEINCRCVALPVIESAT